MSITNKNFRIFKHHDLLSCFENIRQQTINILKAFRDQLGPNLRVPCTKEINLPIWEFCHVAWFSERWICRNPRLSFSTEHDQDVDWKSNYTGCSILDGADDFFDSSEISHKRRWEIDLPSYSETQNYLLKTKDLIISSLLYNKPVSNEDCYFFRLILAHEMMHLEAFKMTAHTLGLRTKDFGLEIPQKALTGLKNQLVFGKNELDDSLSEKRFQFDNEISGENRNVLPFSIDMELVSLEEYLEFTKSKDFFCFDLWSEKGKKWLKHEFEKKSFYNNLHTKTLNDKALKNKFRFLTTKNIPSLYKNPALFISFYEAEAFATWKDRRLPMEAEWTTASENSDFDWGYCWEWTSDTFAGFDNFISHPYTDYSKPWFDGNHKTLKGSSFATSSFFKCNYFRNFYLPTRTDLFSGFRTACSV